MNREETRQVFTQLIADMRLTGRNAMADQLATVLDSYEDQLDDLEAHCDQMTHEMGELEDKLDAAETALIEMVCGEEKSGITGTDN